MESDALRPALSTVRIGWVDYAKTMAIFCVVLLHTHCNAALTDALNGFVMPAFFFISGFLFSFKRNPRFGDFAMKRFRQLVVPYLWLNMVAYAAWLLVLRNYGDDAGSVTGWHEPLVAVALGMPKGLVHDIPLWSLLCFFVVEMVYYAIKRFFGVPDLLLAAIACSVASVISVMAPEEGFDLPFTVVPAAGALAFYSTGHFVAGQHRLCRCLQTPSAMLVIVGIVIFGAGLAMNVPTAFFIGCLGNPLWFFLSASGGVLVVIGLSVFFARLSGDNAAVRFMSRSTLMICGLHILAFAFIKGCMLFMFGVEPQALTANVARGLLMAVAGFGLCLPVAWFVERYAGFLVSK